MGVFIHNNNVLLELARVTLFGWVKELCYRTLTEGVLSIEGLQTIYDVFMAQGNAVSDEPRLTEEQPLQLLKIRHMEGVNALKSGEDIKFCEEGITVIYGQNGTGKSGYFRVLENAVGGVFSKPVLQNLFTEHPANPHCQIEYQEGGLPQQVVEWNNSDETKGIAPLKKVTVFDSRYTDYLVRKHSPDTYLLTTHGFYDFTDFMTNIEKLKEKVAREIPEKIGELAVPELEALNIGTIYDRYLSALQQQLDKELKKLLKRGNRIVVEKILEDGKPYLVVKLQAPHEVEDVLSEGEIKTVALALVLSDLELKQVKNPLILDDPVNSLDNNIIEKFAERLIELDNPVVLFTHNIWLTNAIIKSNKVKRYKADAPLADRQSDKRHIIAYLVTSRGQEKGIVINYDKDNPQYYLAQAKECLDTNPFDARNTAAIIHLLRKSVEMLVDEKILLGLTPCRFRYGNQVIRWTEFLNLKTVSDSLIQTLQEQYSALSSRGTHYGMIEEEDELDHDELEDIYNNLMAVI